jgi:hypothetical protein
MRKIAGGDALALLRNGSSRTLRFAAERKDKANRYWTEGIPFITREDQMHTSFRTAKRAGVAAVFLMIACGLAQAHPGGNGGGFHGGFGGGSHGGGFNHGGFGTMHNSGYGQHYHGFGHSTFGHSSGAFRHSSGMSRTAMHHPGPVSHHTALRSSHHTHLAGNGTPAGFSHGNANWKQNGGTPPGWSHGNKIGWGCKPGSSGCMPPGLAKKQGNGIEPVSHTPRTSSSRMTPVSYTHRPTSAYSHPTPTSRTPTPSSRRPQPGSHTPEKLHDNGAPQ